jgi:hypothetical protein
MLVLKEFGDKNHFYRFLKDKVGVFLGRRSKEATKGSIECCILKTDR